MEANDLESFFLNKDKKKTKKTYAINPSLLFEQTREAELKKAKKVNEKSHQSQEPKSELLRKTKEDEEWEDNADIEVDISSLRIGMMPQKIEETKSVKPPTENESNENDDSDSDNNNSKKVDKSAHPWGNKVVIKTETRTTLPVQPVEAPSQKYIPPGMRGGDMSKVSMSMKQAKRAAPNITNNTEFPSLREVVDNDTEDGTWLKVTKNGHSNPTIQKQPPQHSIVDHTTITKKYIPPPKRDIPNQPEVLSSASMEKPKTEKTNSASSVYLPPHMRNKQVTNPSENRYAGLKHESMN